MKIPRAMIEKEKSDLSDSINMHFYHLRMSHGNSIDDVFIYRLGEWIEREVSFEEPVQVFTPDGEAYMMVNSKKQLIRFLITEYVDNLMKTYL